MEVGRRGPFKERGASNLGALARRWDPDDLTGDLGQARRGEEGGEADEWARAVSETGGHGARGAEVSRETGLAGPARVALAGGRKERGRKRAGAGLVRVAREEKKEMGRGGGREGLGRGKGFGPGWFGLLGWFPGFLPFPIQTNSN